MKLPLECGDLSPLLIAPTRRRIGNAHRVPAPRSKASPKRLPVKLQPFDGDQDRQAQAPQQSRAFTLLEVLLALTIAIGMMIVILFFYQQTALTRSELLRETERLAAVRLVLDRLSSDLRSALNHDVLLTGLFGASDFLQLIRVDRPDMQAWDGTDAATMKQPNSDLRQVGYVLVDAGLLRWEEPFLEALPVVEENEPLPVEPLIEAEAKPQPKPLEAFDTSHPIEPIQHLQFRYWDGYSWWDAWDFLDLPLGVEISLGLRRWEPVEAEETYPYDLYRRTVYLPGSLTSFIPDSEEFAEP